MDNFYPLNEGSLIPQNAVAALIKVDNESYLCQLRDNKMGVFYPNHWGLFGGAVESNEDESEAIKRELCEELGIVIESISYFTEFTFDFTYMNLGKVWRKYFKINISKIQLDEIILGEGQNFKTFYPKDILVKSNVVPYDKFAIWLNEKDLLDE